MIPTNQLINFVLITGRVFDDRLADIRSTRYYCTWVFTITTKLPLLMWSISSQLVLPSSVCFCLNTNLKQVLSVFTAVSLQTICSLSETAIFKTHFWKTFCFLSLTNLFDCDNAVPWNHFKPSPLNLEIVGRFLYIAIFSYFIKRYSLVSFHIFKV